MNDLEHPQGSWSDSLRRSGNSLLGLAQSRFELLAVELQEEKLKAVSTITWLVVAFALVVAGMLVGIGSLALYLWTAAGYLGLIGLALGTMALGFAVLWGVRRQIRNGPLPFGESMSEFRKDIECLRDEN